MDGSELHSAAIASVRHLIEYIHRPNKAKKTKPIGLGQNGRIETRLSIFAMPTRQISTQRERKQTGKHARTHADEREE